MYICFAVIAACIAMSLYHNSAGWMLCTLLTAAVAFFTYDHIEDERVVPALENMTKDLTWSEFTRRHAKLGEQRGFYCIAAGGGLPGKVTARLPRLDGYAEFEMKQSARTQQLVVKTSQISASSTSAAEVQAAVTECIEAIQKEAGEVPVRVKESAQKAQANVDSFAPYAPSETATTEDRNAEGPAVQKPNFGNAAEVFSKAVRTPASR